MNMAKNPSSLRQQHTYALPSLAVTFLIGPLGIIHGIYATEFGLSLVSISFVLLVSNLFDGITDPIIGYYTDRYYYRHGTRKPFVVIGGLTMVVTGYFLYVPTDISALWNYGLLTRVDGNVSYEYFLFWFMAFYLAWTLFEIPHLAWAGDISTDANDKIRIFSLRSATGWLGILLFYCVPLMPMFDSEGFTPETLRWSALAAGLVMLPLVIICVTYTPNGVPSTVASQLEAKYKGTDFIQLLKEFRDNKLALLFFTSAIFAYGGLTGMWYTLIYIYIDSYLGMAEYFPLMSLAALSAGFLMIGVWYRLASCFGVKSVLVLGLLINAFGALGTSFLSAENSGIYSLAAVLFLCFGIGGSSMNLLPSLLAQIVDYSQYKFGIHRSATYFSLNTITAKFAIAGGGALGLAVAGFYGFDPQTKIHSEDNIIGMKIAVSVIPTIFGLIAVALFVLNPMNTRRHTIVRRRLERRA